jgi:DNA polymerase IIIc chi subunit
VVHATCVDARAPRERLLWAAVEQQRVPRGVGRERDPAERPVEVGWGREGPCLRSVRVTASEGRARTLFARPGNRLEGVADNFSTVRRVACVGRASP